MIYLKAKRNITRKMLDRYLTDSNVNPIKKGDVREFENMAGGKDVKTFVEWAPYIYEVFLNFETISEKEFCKAIDDKYLKGEA